VRRSVAASAGRGVQPGDVEVELSPGSVAVRSTVKPPVGVAVEDLRTSLGSSDMLPMSVASAVGSLEGIDAAATGPISVSDVSTPTGPALQVPLLVRAWPYLVAACGLWVCCLAGRTAAARCPEACAEPAEPEDVMPFNGFWVRKGPLQPGEVKGSLIDIRGDKVTWQGGVSRILRSEDDGYLITNPYWDQVLHELELHDGELVVGGKSDKPLVFVRYHRRAVDTDEKSMLLEP